MQALGRSFSGIKYGLVIVSLSEGHELLNSAPLGSIWDRQSKLQKLYFVALEEIKSFLLVGQVADFKRLSPCCSSGNPLIPFWMLFQRRSNLKTKPAAELELVSTIWNTGSYQVCYYHCWQAVAATLPKKWCHSQACDTTTVLKPKLFSLFVIFGQWQQWFFHLKSIFHKKNFMIAWVLQSKAAHVDWPNLSSLYKHKALHIPNLTQSSSPRMTAGHSISSNKVHAQIPIVQVPRAAGEQSLALNLPSIKSFLLSCSSGLLCTLESEQSKSWWCVILLHPKKLCP